MGDPFDATRSLTGRGFCHAKLAADWLKDIVEGPVRLWASPYLRTQQTAQPIAAALNVSIMSRECLQPEMTPLNVMNELLDVTDTVILVTHLPLVGRLASLLIDGKAYDQSWSPAEIWQLEGGIFAPGCLENTGVWYPR